MEGSGFTLRKKVEIRLEVFKILDIQGFSFDDFAENYKKQFKNEKNESTDQYCFLCCFLPHLHPTQKMKTAHFHVLLLNTFSI